MKVKQRKAISKAKVAEQQAREIVTQDFRPPFIDQLPKRAQLVHYKDRVGELENQVQCLTMERRTTQDDNRELKQRCERYERLLDHLTGHQL